MNNQLNQIGSGAVTAQKTGIPNRFSRPYAGLGMCIGVCAGAVAFGGSIPLILLFGLGGGLLIGAAAGYLKARLLYRKRMRITRMEPVNGSTDIMVFAAGDNNVELAYRMTRDAIEKQRMAVGDAVSDVNGALIELEDKKRK